jgi:hypothetical protein
VSAAERWLRPALVAPALVAAAAGLSWWFAGYRLPSSDEGVVLTWAARILRGDVFYQDIDAYQFPGAAYLLASAMWLCGEHLATARGLAAIIYCLVLLGVYRVALHLLDGPRAALCAATMLSFKFLASPGFTAYFYSDVALCCALAAIALLLGHPFRGASWRLAAAGAFAGFALISKQTVGIYLGAVAGVLLLKAEILLGVARRRRADRWAEVGAFAGGATAFLVPFLAYFAAHGVLGRLLYGGLVRPFVGYLPTGSISFLEPLAWWKLGTLREVAGFSYFVGPYWTMVKRGLLPSSAADTWWWLGELFSRLVYSALPLALLGVLLVWWRARRRGRLDADRKLFVYAAFAAAVVLSAFPRADFFHVIDVYPVVLPLLLVLWGRLARFVDARFLGRILETSAVAVLLAVTGLLSEIHHRHLTHHMQVARADLRIAPWKSWVESVVRYLEDETRAGDHVFVYGQEAYYYFLTGRFFPWPFDQLYPGQTGAEGGSELVALLEREPPVFVVHGIAREFAGMPSIPSYAPHLHAYVRSHFVRDDGPFARYPPPGGFPRRRWIAHVLRPRGDAATRGRRWP